MDPVISLLVRLYPAFDAVARDLPLDVAGELAGVIAALPADAPVGTLAFPEALLRRTIVAVYTQRVGSPAPHELEHLREPSFRFSSTKGSAFRGVTERQLSAALGVTVSQLYNNQPPDVRRTLEKELDALGPATAFVREHWQTPVKMYERLARYNTLRAMLGLPGALGGANITSRLGAAIGDAVRIPYGYRQGMPAILAELYFDLLLAPKTCYAYIGPDGMDRERTFLFYKKHWGEYTHRAGVFVQSTADVFECIPDIGAPRSEQSRQKNRENMRRRRRAATGVTQPPG